MIWLYNNFQLLYLNIFLTKKLLDLALFLIELSLYFLQTLEWSWQAKHFLIHWLFLIEPLLLFLLIFSQLFL